MNNITLRKIRIGVVLIIVSLTLSVTCSNGYAYVLANGWNFPSGQNIGVYIESELSDVTIKSNVNKWETYTGRISCDFNAISGQVKFLDNRTHDNDAYAVTFLQSARKKNIVLYKPFKSLNTTRKNETIVHEMGHALGLDHCQTSKNSISVMRAVGFNDKAYPLSDDIAGIKKLY